MYHVSTQGVDERMINVYYYYYYRRMQNDHCTHVKDPVVLSESVDYGNNKIIIIIMYIYHVLINALSAHMIHINLNMIFYTHVEHNPTKTICIQYYTK